MGEVFAGRYELADPIGRGGVGAVWRAWDHRRRRYVAAKVLQQRDAHSLLRFVREQALRIDHPHVLAPASWAADDDKVLFTMDLVAGGSLVHLVGDYGPLPPVFVCTLLDQLLSGLTAVHAEGVVHRDIKPANILLEATGMARPRLRLSDFGIAMRLGEPRLTETNLVVGTPGYLAPEQMMGAEPDFPADLFAVGLVALYLLEGAKPDAKALVQYFAEHGPPSAPKSVPEPLWQVVATLLQPDPQARFRTATGARKALAAATELLPEPGPDDELIEIFDQLGPLPPGFGPDGPPERPKATASRPTRGDTRGDRTTGPPGPGTGSLPARPEADPDGASPGAGSSSPAPAAPAAPSPQGRSGPPARPDTAPGPGHPITDSGSHAGGENSTGSESGSVWPGGGSVRPGTGLGPHPVHSATGSGPDPERPATGHTQDPVRPATGHAPGSWADGPRGDGDSAPTDPRRSTHPTRPTYPTHPPQEPASSPTASGHEPAPLPSMSDTGSFHLPPPQQPSGSFFSDPLPPEPPTPHPPAYAPAPAPATAPPYEPTFVLPTRGRNGEVSTASYTAQDPHAPQARRAPQAVQGSQALRASQVSRAPHGSPSAPAAVSSHGGRRGRRAVRRGRPGPPARVALPLLFLALACYAVGFWALTRI
ncbi:protein kinase [Streptomyces sp. NBC_00377]|uniref:serine/threonine-protein kinase n=1 Tax=unclassified Streptomyces TaxID=2593676 RepID=UPI002E1A4E68|nr:MULTISPECIES: protein kinase [unclassified Streptomyces]